MRNQDFSSAQRAVLDRNGLRVSERWIDTAGTGGTAHVLTLGDGPPIVLLNGIGVPAAMLAPLMARLDGVSQVAVDLPAYGLSDTTPDFALDLRANAVRFLSDVFDGLGLGQAVIVANSLGSLWSSWLAIEHPDRVAGLVHVGWPAVALGTSAPLPMRLLSVRPIGRLLTRVQRPSRRQVAQLSKMVNEHPLPDEIADLILATERLDHFRPTFLATLHALLRLRGSRPGSALGPVELRDIEVPTLLVLGRDDPFGTVDQGRRFVEAMPNAELEIVDGGHAPWIRSPDRIAEVLNRYLREHAGVGCTPRSAPR